MKKSLLLTLGLLCAAGVSAQAMKMPELHFNPPPRKIKVDKNAKQVFAENGKVYFGIVIPDDAGGPAKYAAEELALFLGKALNAKIPVAKQRDAKWKHAIILGDNTLSRKAGLNVKNLTRDGFLMKTVGNDIYIAGLDDKDVNTKKLMSRLHFWGEQPMMHQRGTIFGVYDFLERFAGVRFYLPIDLGIIVPKLAKLEVPRVDIFDRPDHAVRTTTGFNLMFAKPWQGGKYNSESKAFANRALLRFRGGTRGIPNCHGLQILGYPARFGKTHPEYFIQSIKGKRDINFICLRSNIVNEIIEDAKSALRGEPPDKRKIDYSNGRDKYRRYFWMPQVYHKDGFFNVHLMDGMQGCFCEKCKKEPLNAEDVWKMTARVANAVQDAKIPGWITQMGYNHYREVPEIDLPDNVIVQLAFTGPFAMNEPDQIKYQYDLVKRWNKKLNGRKVWLWVYLDATEEKSPGGDWCYFPGISQNAPYTIAKYFQDQKKDISGCMVEISGAPKDWINLHTCMRVMWNNDLDINKYMDEFYSLMFGKAAPILKPYFMEAEKIWIYKVRGKSIETPLGPKPFKMPQSKIWEEFYPKSLLDKWSKMFDRAEAAVKNSPEHLARVQFFRKYYFSSALKTSEAYWKERTSTEILQSKVPVVSAPVAVDGKLNDAVWSKAVPNYLAKFRFGETPIRASVKVLRDNKYLYFGFESIDPKHSELELGDKPLPNQNVVNFATFEVLLNPSKDLETVYHYLINPSGKFIAIKHLAGKPFKADHKVATYVGKDRWSAELAVPLSLMKDMKNGICPANFSYNRQLKNAKSTSDLYTWSPYLALRFFEPDHFAKLVFNDDAKSINMLNDYDFAGLKFIGRTMGAHWSWGTHHETAKIEFDTQNFVTGGQSLRMSANVKNIGDRGIARTGYRHMPTLKPGKKYRLSFYAKGDLTPGSLFDARIWRNDRKTVVIPSGRMSGKFNWTKVSREFNAPADGSVGMGFTLYGGGTVNFDHVVLQEVTE